MSEGKYHYIWEKSRKLYRVVVDKPEYNPATKKTRHHYVTVGKAKGKDAPIEFGEKFKLASRLSDPGGAEQSPIRVKDVILSGEKLVLDKIGNESGLGECLRSALGKEKAGKIMSLAYYLVCTGDALCSAEEWQGERKLPVLPGPRVSELLPELTSESCAPFFRSWSKAKAKGKRLCYDITSISTYADGNDMAEFGYNRDHEGWLRQINLAVVSDQDAHIPLAFRPLSGSLSDSVTLDATLRDFEAYDAKPYGLVMDRGFYSQGNLDLLSARGVKVMIPVPSSLKWARDLIGRHKDDVFSQDYRTDSDGGTTFGYTVYDPLGEGKRVWAHVYYSPSIETARKEKFAKQYMDRRGELEKGIPDERYRKFYDEYFTVSTRGRGGKPHIAEVTPLKDVLSGMNFGYWVLYTDIEKDAMKALEDYRTRSFIEAGFDDLKGATDAKRLRVHHSGSVFGRLFIQFCAQVLRSGLRNRINSFPADTKKYASSPGALLSRVRHYSKVSYRGKYKSQYTEMTKGQRLIFKELGLIDGKAIKESEDETDTESLLN